MEYKGCWMHFLVFCPGEPTFTMGLLKKMPNV
uniref:Uncharacterized protein n=1 Tax=Schistosoma japonicum TaxID=6182 RepID=Q5BZ14_SCHJA|nr:unknown [Schistosoma japonicum]